MTEMNHEAERLATVLETFAIDHKSNQQAAALLRKLSAENEALKGLLADAADDVDYCRQYMSEYLQEKGGYAEVVETYRKAAIKQGEKQ